ncbi:MAG: putative 4-hydroxybenzoate polyprenyltransferase [Abditibacteriales bacterium]|nr:putative 4-hydroxybenzoate polyprenyltransferase [Abditibacteriales bacterium]MDW8368214.1 UbiA-like polyprenyltransferase [Abditibacteriales bacterium]
MKRLLDFLEMIKFQHTVFALPFALTSAMVCARFERVIWLDKLGWILLAMVGARSAAMGFNRIVDLRYDALNPRTQNRELPTGKITVRQASVLVAVAAALFVLAAYQLNTLAFVLSFPALFIILFYSYTKRFTSFCHLILGFGIGIAPFGAWIALTGRWAWQPLLLTVAVMFWVAGFDIIYATLDEEFDKKMGLHSMVRRWGVACALRWARWFHVLFFVALIAFGAVTHLGSIYYIGVVAIGAFLAYEHALVRPDDLRRVNMAFFTVNGVISVTMLVVTAIDLMVHG